MSGTAIHLRAETKPLEHRSALTPTTAKALVDAGYKLSIERSSERIFDDSEFEGTGATLVPEGSWKEVPEDTIILGLKELPEEDFPLRNPYVLFHHCYKQQEGWEQILSRYAAGGGRLYDLEFLEREVAPDRYVRVAAFGWSAGYAGAALAIENWAWQLTNPDKPFPSVESYPNQDKLIADVKQSLATGQAKAGKLPRVIIIGALGRCGRGAIQMCEAAGIPSENILKWDIEETSAKPGPYPEIVESDIFVNCIYLSKPIPPFVNMESLNSPKRNLSVVCDVSADTTNPHNPVPIYTVATTFDKPTVPVEGLLSSPPLSVISIDHLPSLLPRESSETYSNDLLPYLLTLKDRDTDPVWTRAEKLFHEKVATLPKKEN